MWNVIYIGTYVSYIVVLIFTPISITRSLIPDGREYDYEQGSSHWGLRLQWSTILFGTKWVWATKSYINSVRGYYSGLVDIFRRLSVWTAGAIWRHLRHHNWLLMVTRVASWRRLRRSRLVPRHVHNREALKIFMPSNIQVFYFVILYIILHSYQVLQVILWLKLWVIKFSLYFEVLFQPAYPSVLVKTMDIALLFLILQLIFEPRLLFTRKK